MSKIEELKNGELNDIDCRISYNKDYDGYETFREFDRDGKEIYYENSAGAIRISKSKD